MVLLMVNTNLSVPIVMEIIIKPYKKMPQPITVYVHIMYI